MLLLLVPLVGFRRCRNLVVLYLDGRGSRGALRAVLPKGDHQCPPE